MRLVIAGMVTALALVLALLGADRLLGERMRPCDETGDAPTSFLAVGDFGKPPLLLPALDPRVSVARSIDEVHRCRPVSALLMLGDNFYPGGLHSDNFEARVRDTLVGPFCRFLSLSGEHGESLASSCGLRPNERVPVPIVAVMGNHDYEPPVDGSFEKERLPRWIPEWRMPAGTARIDELAAGLSVISIDSVRLHEGAGFEEVERALVASRGRFRILIAHHPLVRAGTTAEQRYADGLVDAVRRSGRPVHLLLAGHEHHLAASRTGLDVLPLQLVAGSGSRVRSPRHTLLGESRQWLSLGYIRLAIRESPGGATLESELVRVPRLAIFARTGSETIARHGIRADGRLVESARDQSLARAIFSANR